MSRMSLEEANNPQPPVTRLDDEQLSQLKDQLRNQLRNDRGESLLNNQTGILNQLARLTELATRQSNRTHGGRPPTWGTTWTRPGRLSSAGLKPGVSQKG